LPGRAALGEQARPVTVLFRGPCYVAGTGWQTDLRPHFQPFRIRTPPEIGLFIVGIGGGFLLINIDEETVLDKHPAPKSLLGFAVLARVEIERFIGYKPVLGANRE
jgi:hypothetical protein